MGTLAVNLTGAFLLGLLVGAGVQGRVLLLAGTATLGSYTTSTWMFESHRLGEDGGRRLAVPTSPSASPPGCWRLWLGEPSGRLCEC